MFSEIVQNFLMAGGWKSNRKIDVRTYKSALKAAGYGVPPLLKDFFEKLTVFGEAYDG
jgi:hypothetical protein